MGEHGTVASHLGTLVSAKQEHSATILIGLIVSYTAQQNSAQYPYTNNFYNDSYLLAQKPLAVFILTNFTTALHFNTIALSQCFSNRLYGNMQYKQ